jgi:hypothetical protein
MLTRHRQRGPRPLLAGPPELAPTTSADGCNPRGGAGHSPITSTAGVGRVTPGRASWITPGQCLCSLLASGTTAVLCVKSGATPRYLLESPACVQDDELITAPKASDTGTLSYFPCKKAFSEGVAMVPRGRSWTQQLGLAAPSRARGVGVGHALAGEGHAPRPVTSHDEAIAKRAHLGLKKAANPGPSRIFLHSSLF